MMPSGRSKIQAIREAVICRPVRPGEDLSRARASPRPRATNGCGYSETALGNLPDCRQTVVT
jgi:hypothetical protein